MTPSASATQPEDFEPTGAFEVIKVLGRELQYSKERIKQLESALSETSSSFDPDGAKELIARAEKAEDLSRKLREELTESQNLNEKMNIKVDKLQARIDKLKAMKQERNESNETAALSEGRQSKSRIIGLETDLKNGTREKEELEAKLVNLERETLRLKGRIKKDEAAHNAMVVSNRQMEMLEKVWTIEKYIEFSEDLPKCHKRPDYISLRPICDANFDLRTYLEADKDLGWLTQSFMCLPSPGRLLWASTSCQVGFAFGPMYQYHPDGKNRGWVKQSVYNNRYGKQFELFFKNGDHTYYAGRYICQNIRANNPQGCLRLDPESATALADATFPSRASGSESIHDALWAMVKSLYMEGILQAECAILRCVGFSQKAHDLLSSRYDILKTLEMRRADERRIADPPRGPKRRRRHSGTRAKKDV